MGNPGGSGISVAFAGLRERRIAMVEVGQCAWVLYDWYIRCKRLSGPQYGCKM